MNDRTSLFGLICRITALLTLCSATAYQGYSQEAEAEAEDSDEEIYDLSPFTVSTRDDRGYLSNQRRLGNFPEHLHPGSAHGPGGSSIRNS